MKNQNIGLISPSYAFPVHLDFDLYILLLPLWWTCTGHRFFNICRSCNSSNLVFSKMV